MAIVRSKVIWIGDKPDPALEREFRLRDHELEHWTYDKFSEEPAERLDAICGAKAVFYIHDPAKRSRTIEFIRIVTTLPASYSGVLPYVVMSDVDDIPAVQGIPEIKEALEKYPVPFIGLPAVSEYSERVQAIARQFPGRYPNLNLEILGNDADKLCPEERVLLQRSFSDCRSIKVIEMSSGFSAKVMTVFAELSVEGQSIHAIPFVAKFDDGGDIEIELNNYTDYIDYFVPFYLRPGIDHSRCFFSQPRGVIVASFVDHSLPLLQAINLGLGSAALHSLFEETLGSWLHNSTPNSDISIYLSLQKDNPKTDRVVLKKFSDGKVLSEAQQIAQVLEPADLLQAIEALPCAKFLYGTSHKDLHAKNVLVRGGDAVVIDFPRCDKGPILLDVATLDVSILFDSAPAPPKIGDHVKERQKILEEEFKRKSEQWKAVVCDAFRSENVLNLPNHKGGHEPFARHWACIRQLRRLALLDQKDRREYAICVTIELLRRAMFLDSNPSVAGYAYYLTDRLAKSLKTES